MKRKLTEKAIPKSEAPEGAKYKLVDTVVNFISLVGDAANERVFLIKRKDVHMDGNWTKFVAITKVDEFKHLVYGTVYAPDDTDAHGDYMDAATIRKMGEDFLRAGRANNIDVEHDEKTAAGGLSESWIVKAGDSMFPNEKVGAWVVAIKVDNDEIWDKVLAGELKGLSLGGFAYSEPVVPDENLPGNIDEDIILAKTDKPWNTEAACARIKKSATNEDETIDIAKYKTGFAWHDKTDDTLTAYKLLHHDVVEGKLVVVWRGVQAAMGALLGARGGVKIPDAERSAVYNHLTAHYKQFDREPPELEKEDSVKNQHKKGLLSRFALLPDGVSREDVSALKKASDALEIVRTLKADGPVDFEEALQVEAFNNETWDFFYVFRAVVENIFETDVTLEDKIDLLNKSGIQFLARLRSILVDYYVDSESPQEVERSALGFEASVITANSSLLDVIESLNKAGSKMSRERFKRFETIIESLKSLLDELKPSDDEEDNPDETSKTGKGEPSMSDKDEKALPKDAEELKALLEKAGTDAVDEFKETQKSDEDKPDPETKPDPKDGKGKEKSKEKAEDEEPTLSDVMKLLGEVKTEVTELRKDFDDLDEDISPRLEQLEVSRFGKSGRVDNTTEDDDDDGGGKKKKHVKGASFGAAVTKTRR